MGAGSLAHEALCHGVLMQEPTPIAFGQYLPDLSPYLNPGLLKAENMVPITGGYAKVNALAALTGFSALAERPRGSVAGIDNAGNPYNFVGTETKLYELAHETTDVTRTIGAYNCSGQSTWELAVFEDFVLAVNINDDSQSFEIGMSTNFVQLGNPLATKTVAPRARHIGILGTFVILGNTFDSTNGTGPNVLHWSARNNPFNWPTPGSDVARAVQSDRQPLAGDGGQVQRVISGAEVGLAFQERQVYRLDYQGGDVIFSLNRLEQKRGLLVPQICIPFGRQVFFLSEDGFYLHDYTESTSIGHERVDKTFLADIDLSNAHRVSAAQNPDRKEIWILYPGSGNTNGVPNKFLVYNWALDQFSHGLLDAEWITEAVNAGLTIDSPGAVGDPDDTTDDPAFPDGGVDSSGLESFDARIAAPGSMKLGAFNTSFVLSDFSGAGLTGTIETGRRALRPIGRSLTEKAEIIVESASPTIQAASVSRAKNSLKYGHVGKINEDGVAPLRVDGRFHSFRVSLPTGWDNALGLNVWSASSGQR